MNAFMSYNFSARNLALNENKNDNENENENEQQQKKF